MAFAVLARFIAELEGITQPQDYQIHTLGGRMVTKLGADGLVTVDMGEPRLAAEEIPTTLTSVGQKVVDRALEVAGQSWNVTCVSMGNPPLRHLCGRCGELASGSDRAAV